MGEDAAEPEEKTKSYDEYLAEQAEKRLALSGNALNTRKANEGSKQKFPTGTEFKRENEEFFAGAEEKARRERQQKDKNRLNLEGQYYAPAVCCSCEEKVGRRRLHALATTLLCFPISGVC